MTEIIFLSIDDVKEIQEEQIELYGGGTGIRDESMLKSAMTMPQMGFGDQYLHETLFDMASAYAYHIAQNHPFIDGNKRTALATALVFLKINGIEITDPKGKLEPAMWKVASGKMAKEDLARLFEQLVL